MNRDAVVIASLAIANVLRTVIRPYKEKYSFRQLMDDNPEQRSTEESLRPILRCIPPLCLQRRYSKDSGA